MALKTDNIYMTMKTKKKNINDILSESTIDRILTESIRKVMREGTINDPDYTHYAILKPQGKIVFGWDYNGYDPADLRNDKRYYFITDMVDNGFNPKDIKILTKKACIRQGINPDEDSNWTQGSDYMVNEESLSENYVWHGDITPFQEIKKNAQIILDNFSQYNGEDDNVEIDIVQWAQKVIDDAEQFMATNSNNTPINGGENW